MTTTPPPPSRLRTPPTPLHGPKYDNHEPYSPRRSSRIHTRQTTQSSADAVTSLKSKMFHSGHISELHSLSKPNIRRTTSQTFSPPSSPMTPSKETSNFRLHHNVRGTFLGSRQTGMLRSFGEPDSDMDAPRFPSKSLGNGQPGVTGYLPTPRKTPSKRPVQHDEQLSSTARVLFPSHHLDLEEATSSPRKPRKGKNHIAFSLEDLADERNGGSGGKMKIYTDSKERVPVPDEGGDEQNPFVVRKSGRKTRSTELSDGTTRKRSATQNGMSEEVDQAVANDEGMVYVFRGKKIFRRFADQTSRLPVDGEVSEDLSDQETRRRAGVIAGRHFTRSSIKPRLLFPPKEPVPEPDAADEEATTDIEGPVPEIASELDEKTVTPVKQPFCPATPPTTSRRTRANMKVTPDSSPLGLGSDSALLEIPRVRFEGKKSSAFDTWQRKKPTGRSVSMKRQGELMEKADGTAGKRSRSANHLVD